MNLDDLFFLKNRYEILSILHKYEDSIGEILNYCAKMDLIDVITTAFSSKIFYNYDSLIIGAYTRRAYRVLHYLIDVIGEDNINISIYNGNYYNIKKYINNYVWGPLKHIPLTLGSC